MGIKLVCFDLGGVLVRICRTWEEAATYAGLHAPHNRWGEPAQRQARWRVMQDYQTGKLTSEEYFLAVSELSEGHYSAPQIGQLHAAWTREEYPGIAEIVLELKAQTSVVTACLSNTNAAHWARLMPDQNSSPQELEYPTVAQLHHRLASHLMGLAKPDPSIYRDAELSFGCEANEVLFFDDLEENVAAAAERGWHTQLVDHTGDTATQIRNALVRFDILA